MQALFFNSLLLLKCMSTTLTHPASIDSYCYAIDPNNSFSRHFGSVTEYQDAKGPDAADYFNVPGCKPVRIWHLVRHGTRIPDKSAIDRMECLENLKLKIMQNHSNNRATMGLCNEDIQLLGSWYRNPNVTSNTAKFLTSQAWNTMKTLAQTFQQLYPQLYIPVYSLDKYYFSFTGTQRCEASAKAYADGIFGDGFQKNVHFPIPFQKDTVLKPYLACPLRDAETYHDFVDTTEQDKFKESSLMKQVIFNISSRLGFRQPLQFGDIQAMYDQCRQDHYLNGEHPSPWCTVFRHGEIDILEYWEDLQHQYETGYTSGLKPCRIMQDMLRRIHFKYHPWVAAQFAHSSTIHTVLTALGAYKDEHLLKANNYHQMSQRKWRTSNIGPFSANIAVVKCPSETGDTLTLVRFIHNQKPLDLEWCPKGICAWKDVLQKYRHFLTIDCSNYCDSDYSYFEIISYVVACILIVCLCVCIMLKWRRCIILAKSKFCSLNYIACPARFFARG